MDDLDKQIEELLGRLVGEFERQSEAGELGPRMGDHQRQFYNCGGFVVRHIVGRYGSYLIAINNVNYYLPPALSDRIGCVFHLEDEADELAEKQSRLARLEEAVGGLTEKV
jgi:hypothetical protein